MIHQLAFHFSVAFPNIYKQFASPVQCPLQVLMGHIKVVVGVLSAGEGIGAARVLAQELAVLILLGVLLCPQKQHVFTEVGHAGNVRRVRERSYERQDYQQVAFPPECAF